MSLTSSTETPPEEPAARPFPTGLLVAGILATVVLAVAVVVAVRSGSSPAPSSGPTSTFGAFDQLGRSGPDLTGQLLPDVHYALFGGDGTRSVSDEYRGRPLVINFWASTCAPCVTEMPDFQKVHEQFGDQVAFLGLDVTDAEDSGQAMLDKTKVRYDVGRDPQGDAITALGGSVLPTTVLVGADGTVKLVHPAQMSADDLTAAIQQHLLG
jgi:thiol-disulfide isomerase/thioredoxin